MGPGHIYLCYYLYLLRKTPPKTLICPQCIDVINCNFGGMTVTLTVFTVTLDSHRCNKLLNNNNNNNNTTLQSPPSRQQISKKSNKNTLMFTSKKIVVSNQTTLVPVFW